jgi:hypothetical protein
MKKRQGYAVHSLESLEGKNLIALHQLTADDMYNATKFYVRREGSKVGTVIGVGADGLIASERENWSPDMPDAYQEVFIVVPWVQLLALLGRVPDEAVAALLETKH